jgi:hypothetical protein
MISSNQPEPITSDLRFAIADPAYVYVDTLEVLEL